ncbi:Heme exporter protein CcmD [uncultured Alphaproteobacteria bacterium]|jgi:heme exporter protein D|uniref:Heme exporter protein D n=1 Tax=uncultured Alphaproteobacteria bacterium TaxID=91750 RepID=A0A212KH46_9PROT|nr:Heme exporter protein CcmD [uncultured Alphaproteobacteria bacterium]
MTLHGPYTAYVIGAYAVTLLALGVAALAAWRDWRRARAAWARIEGGRPR